MHPVKVYADAVGKHPMVRNHCRHYSLNMSILLIVLLVLLLGGGGGYYYNRRR